MASLFTSGRDNSCFPDANEFQPWRWTRDSTGKLKCVNNASGSMPFALGSRNCVGQKLANLQIQNLLSEVRHFFFIFFCCFLIFSFFYF